MRDEVKAKRLKEKEANQQPNYGQAEIKRERDESATNLREAETQSSVFEISSED